MIVVASAAVIFGAFVIHANRRWFAREFRRMLFPKALVILALVLASSAPAMAGNLSGDQEMWLRHYAAAWTARPSR